MMKFELVVLGCTAMSSAIASRLYFSAVDLCRLARQSRDAVQARRLLPLAAINEGHTRSEAAQLGNVTLQVVRDRAPRFNAEGLDKLVDRKIIGPTPLLTNVHRKALAGQINRGLTPASHGVVRWRLCCLGQ